MEQIYTTSNGTKIFRCVLAAVLVAFACFFINVINKNDATVVGVLMGLLFMGMAAILVINAFRKKITIYDDRIEYICSFSSGSVDIADVKGYRINKNRGNKNLVLVLSSGSKVSIPNYNDLADSDELETWMENHFTDLDAVDVAHEKEEILHDSRFGATEEERASKLNQAKQLANVYNVAGLVIGFGLVFFDMAGTN